MVGEQLTRDSFIKDQGTVCQRQKGNTLRYFVCLRIPQTLRTTDRFLFLGVSQDRPKQNLNAKGTLAGSITTNTITDELISTRSKLTTSGLIQGNLKRWEETNVSHLYKE
jgi:hypothetical protein